MGGEAYTVRRPRVGALAPLLVLPVFLVATQALGLPAFPRVVVVLFLVFAAYVAWQRTLVLKVDAEGVQLGRGIEYVYGRQQLAGAAVPWAAIRELVLFTGVGDPEIGLRLREGAPMPSGVRGIIRDPERPDEVPPSLRTKLPNVDRQRLAGAVSAFGRGARLVDATG